MFPLADDGGGEVSLSSLKLRSEKTVSAHPCRQQEETTSLHPGKNHLEIRIKLCPKALALAGIQFIKPQQNRIMPRMI